MLYNIRKVMNWYHNVFKNIHRYLYFLNISLKYIVVFVTLNCLSVISIYICLIEKKCSDKWIHVLRENCWIEHSFSPFWTHYAHA